MNFSLADIQPVILAGGAGRRLWPLSTTARPKPFLRLLAGGQSLLSATAQRTAPMCNPFVVGNVAHRDLILDALRQANIAPARLLLEPCGRGTAPALAAAAHLAGHRDNPFLLVMPSDHVMGDTDVFYDAVTRGMAAADDGHIVTFGIKPRRVETRYGYIEAATPHGEGARPITRFVEKPPRAQARTYCAAPDWFWNSGLFLVRAHTALALLPEDVSNPAGEAVRRASARQESVLLADAPWQTLPNISIDRAIMERTAKGAVIPAAMMWDDIGTWPALLGMRARALLPVRRKTA